MTKSFGFKTDKGMVRPANEDAFLVMPECGVYAVMDGVGGNNAGELASGSAAAGIGAYVRENPPAKAKDFTGDMAMLEAYFLECLQKINREILAAARSDSRNFGMATTVVLAYASGGKLLIVNVGDSRAYLVRGGEIRQITEDHTYVNKLLKIGDLTEQEAAIHPQRNVITRALGAEDYLEPDFFELDVKKGDRILLCTDGLHGELSNADICRIVSGNGEPQAICDELITCANNNGGSDNVTVVCIELNYAGDGR